MTMGPRRSWWRGSSRAFRSGTISTTPTRLPGTPMTPSTDAHRTRSRIIWSCGRNTRLCSVVSRARARGRAAGLAHRPCLLAHWSACAVQVINKLEWPDWLAGSGSSTRVPPCSRIRVWGVGRHCAADCAARDGVAVGSGCGMRVSRPRHLQEGVRDRRRLRGPAIGSFARPS